MELKRWDNNEVIFSGEFQTKKEMLEAAVKQGANLRGAYLEEAYLEGANLEEAYLEGANLEGANLEGANLEGAYLRGAYLKGANLRGANLRGANLGGAYLKGANLGGAYLEEANLEGANLEGAYLEGAYLGGANLRGAYLEEAYLEGAYLDMKFNSVVHILASVDWGTLPDDLCLEMMRHDAESCGTKPMTEWAKGGGCPFQNGKRDYLFIENKSLWKSGKPLYRGKELLVRLAAAKNINLIWG